MYGLINRAIQEMVCQKFGQETWDAIKTDAAIQETTFLALEPYPDEVTHTLVASASKILALSPSEIMQAFGQYWISYTSTNEYKEIMAICGESLKEFLGNLDDLHSRIGVQFPALQAPSFTCDEIDKDTLELHYSSTREGLAPMVVGLVEGLGEKFSTDITVKQVKSRAQGSDQDTFEIKYKTDQ